MIRFLRSLCIVSLRNELDKKTGKLLEVTKDAQDLAGELFLHQKCKGLTESQKEKVFSILQRINDKEEIDRKFDVIMEKKIMFEDLTPEQTRDDLEQEIDEMKDLIREARDTIVDLREENGVLERKYNESYNDARRFAKAISDTLTGEEREKAFKEIEEQEELLEKWNLQEPD